ncbi:glucose-6-phosphate isomerase [Croceimicrobium sp.]|uniref:glucose-6-phosphate isomerase n=1 Tax=Croceimicrobium sp. TaxID=2828340 RepID=UPI003BABFFA9
MLKRIDPSQTKAWTQLESKAREMRAKHLNDLFAEDPNRFEKMKREHKDLLFDFSKNLIDQESFALLEALFAECGVKEGIQSMLSGEKINETEDRAVLHTALRNFSDEEILVDGQSVNEDIENVLEQMQDFSDLIISGNWKGYSGKTIKHIVNIGIGGSDLGPLMVYEALKPYHNHLHCHYVSNVDGAHINETLKDLDPEQTLFIIASKTFTTQETMTNARSAREWFLRSNASENDIAKHFVAVSTNREKVIDFGIDPTNMFVFWDWVGGRYSVWSAIGLSLACGLGYKNFEKFLRGAHSMDRHLAEADFKDNIPMQMAALGIWYVNFLGAESEAIIPYDQNMHRFAAYFQQGNMESNGKYIDRNGEKVSYATGPIIWGEPGTNGQHAFFQLMHQGTRFIPADFIAFAESHYNMGDHHLKLLSNFLAQTEALMVGKTRAEVEAEMTAKGNSEEEIAKIAPYRVFEGNRPTTSILGQKSDPESLGALVAAYEHKIFIQGIVWNIYSFDQWGVELGKALANTILPLLSEGGEIDKDASTKGLITYIRNRRGIKG